MSPLRVFLATLFATVMACGGANGGSQDGVVILATTTSLQDSGLLDELLPLFEERTGINVKPIPVGSGQALTMGRRGDADLLLVHSPDAEREFMGDGFGAARRLVMHNDFLIAGPAADPAGTIGKRTASEAFSAIAESRENFVSRGDASGTHALELKLWRAAAIEPVGESWYLEAGQGMGATIQIADQKAGYVLTDRATYLALRPNLRLEPVSEGDPLLLNLYHVITLNPARSPRANASGAQLLADFLLSAEVQRLIGAFGEARFGEALFVPDAGRSEADLGPS